MEIEKGLMAVHPGIDFTNTEKAYISKTTEDLIRAKWLFKLLQQPLLGNIGQKLMGFAVKAGLPVDPIIKQTLYKQFIGGETLEDCKRLTNSLGTYNVYGILDYALEGGESDEHFQKSVNEFIRNIDYAAETDYIPVSVFKPSAISVYSTLEKLSASVSLTEGEKKQYSRIKDRFDLIFSHAHKREVPIMVDAEHSWYQKIIDRLVLEAMEFYNKERAIVINTFQMYRKDRLEYLKECHRIAREKGFILGVKLVRGAYLEQERMRAKKMGYPSPVQDTKADTDRDYNLALKYCIENHEDILVTIASHNEQSTYYAIQLMEEQQLDPDYNHIWFSQLYGMCDHISFNLGQNGYHSAKYIPYGTVKSVVPYLLRRAEENSSVTSQVSRELALINKELERRKVVTQKLS